jgi:hypothetical protein
MSAVAPAIGERRPGVHSVMAGKMDAGR